MVLPLLCGELGLHLSAIKGKKLNAKKRAKNQRTPTARDKG
jgi:hypothetical protein